MKRCHDPFSRPCSWLPSGFAPVNWDSNTPPFPAARLHHTSSRCWGMFIKFGCFHPLSFLCGTRLRGITLAFIRSQSCLSRGETQLRCTEEKICPKKLVRKRLCFKQKYPDQAGGLRGFLWAWILWGATPRKLNFHDTAVPNQPWCLHTHFTALRKSLQNLSNISTPASGHRII